MATFNNNPELKKSCLEQAAIAQHRIESGDDKSLVFWSRHRWCDPDHVCTVPDCTHEFYSKEIGVPVEIAYAERAFYNSLPGSTPNSWGRSFLQALPVGVELDEIWSDLALYILANGESALLNHARSREENDAIVSVIELFENKVQDRVRWSNAVESANKCTSARSHVHPYSAGAALTESGVSAAVAAGAFARSFLEPRFAAEAIKLAPKPIEWKAYNRFLAPQKDPRQESISQTMSGWDERKELTRREKAWKQIMERAAREGEAAYNARLEFLSHEFLNRIRATAPPTAVSQFFSNLFGTGKKPKPASSIVRAQEL